MAVDEEYEYVDLRDELPQTTVDEEEVYADTFAASLLMPPAEVKTLAKGRTVAQMQLDFGVSGEDMQNRVSYLGFK